jgi:nucleotide-binding universal stress UspA family protein
VTKKTAQRRARGNSARHPTPKPIPRSVSKFKIETILIPIDFSAESLYSIGWAKFVARLTNASIHFVNVHDFGYPVAAALTPPVVGSETEIRDHLHRDLQIVAISQGISHPSFHIRAGRAFHQVCELAGEIGADLIVISTHGRTGWERAFLGSTAERIVQHATVPVLVARRPPRKKIRLRKILVPVDFSFCAAQGLRYAIRFAQTFGVELMLLNVVQLHRDLPTAVIYSEARMKRWSREVAQAHLADLITEADFGGVKFTGAVRFGAPAQTIDRVARQSRSDLIICSTHGRSGFQHVVMGSVAEQIVRYARRPVLVVPNHARG